MATFAELCSDVYVITKRPDLVDETKLAVKAATLKMHHTDYYYKDLYETTLAFASPEYLQTVDIKALFPRFRSLRYCRRYDSSGTGAAKNFYQILSPDSVLDDYGIDRVNVAYMAGSVLNIKSAEKLDYLLLGFYQNPVITEGGYSSWIAVDHQFAIEFEAARMLFKQIGFDEQAATYDRLAGEQVILLKQNNLLVEGY